MIHAAFRGIVAAMAMTGVRTLAQHLGVVREDPPARVARKQAKGLLRSVPRRRRDAVVEGIHWGMGAVFGLVFGMLPDRDPPEAVVRPGVRLPRLGRASTRSSRRRSGSSSGAGRTARSAPSS